MKTKKQTYLNEEKTTKNQKKQWIPKERNKKQKYPEPKKITKKPKKKNQK